MKYNLTPEQMPIIAIDFDGVIVEDRWPEIGPAIPGAIETINQWYEEGFWIIINSCRSGDEESDMRAWLINNHVNVHAINCNLGWRIQKYRTNPRKIGADIYIDDHNIEQVGHITNEDDWGIFRGNVDFITKEKEQKLN